MLQQNFRATAPVGVALLGTRTAIPEELRTALPKADDAHPGNFRFEREFYWPVRVIAHMAGLGRKEACLTPAGILGYLFIADAQPPVMRAVLMIVALLAVCPGIA